jgi:methylenetetrahydrofolate dehydrogenase (NADP+) / methenyltetrahydrofolate cyclohydrolase
MAEPSSGTAKVISGKEISARIRDQLKVEIEKIKQQDVVPGIAVILIGDDPASHSYVKGKEKASMELEMYSEMHRLPEQISQQEVLDLIGKLNRDPKIHGILVQLPIPKHISEHEVILAIDPKKDVDGFHPINIGNMQSGLPAFLPCTPHGVIHMLKLSGVQISGKHAVVIGRSNIVGKPMAQLLLAEDATVTICHSRTQDVGSFTRQADILVAAVGRPKTVTAEMVKPGAVVIDVGVNRVDGKLIGDCDYAEVSQVASMITPVPGGVGPMTITMLMYNTVESAKRHLQDNK